MARRTQPEFVAAEDLNQQERARLALFLYTLRKQPNVMLAIIDGYTTQTDLIEDYEHPRVQAVSELLESYRDNAPFEPAAEDYPYYTEETKALFAVGGLLRHNIDVRAQPDRITAEAMRIKIAEERRSGSRREPRLVRLGELAVEEASYQMYVNVVSLDVERSQPEFERLGESYPPLAEPGVA
ncbi:MAG: hypothetical protein ACQR33_00625 [Candidatus Saccharibacteria bacterium]